MEWINNQREGISVVNKHLRELCFSPIATLPAPFELSFVICPLNFARIPRVLQWIVRGTFVELGTASVMDALFSNVVYPKKIPWRILDVQEFGNDNLMCRRSRLGRFAKSCERLKVAF